MNRGINRAEKLKDNSCSLFESYVRNDDEKGTCVFVSYRSADREQAVAIARYIKDSGIDVYIDVSDEGLQIATVEDNPQSVVNYIHNGLLQSTHILVLISDDTKESWWVPYEIGYGENAGKIISSMMLTDSEVESFPDYLKVFRRLFSVTDFLDYIRGLKNLRSRYGGMFEDTHPYELPDERLISGYIKEVGHD